MASNGQGGAGRGGHRIILRVSVRECARVRVRACARVPAPPTIGGIEANPRWKRAGAACAPGGPELGLGFLEGAVRVVAAEVAEHRVPLADRPLGRVLLKGVRAVHVLHADHVWPEQHRAVGLGELAALAVN